MTKVRWTAIAVLALGISMILPVSRPSSASAASGIGFRFAHYPIATAGTIGPGQTVPLTLRVLNNGLPFPGGQVYLQYYNTGHVNGDITTVPSGQNCVDGFNNPVTQFPTDGSVISCLADSSGNVAMTYTTPTPLPAQGHVGWIAETSSGHNSLRVIDHYVYTSVYRFTSSPVAPGGSLAPSASVPVTLTSEDGLNHGQPNYTVYMSFNQAAGGGAAAVGSTPLTSTPQLFTTDGTGALQITYTAPAVLPTGGQDAIVAQDLLSAASSMPIETSSDSYAFSSSAPVLSIGDAATVEPDQHPGSPGAFTVTIAPVQKFKMTFQYVTLCGIGDKECSEDFTQVLTPRIVSIPANTSSVTISVTQFGYTADAESYNEGWYVELVHTSVGVVGRAVGNGMLLPDIEMGTSFVPLLYVGDVGVQPCADPGGVTLQFTITLAAAQGSPVTVNYATADGTAFAGVDYTSATGTATISPGQTYVLVPVVVLPGTPGTARTFSLTISNPSGGLTISRATGTGTLLGA
jgi:hypothetical protein